MRFNITATLALFGVILIFLGLLCATFIFPRLERHLIAQETAMKNGTKTFESWKKIPFPFKFKIYFFNVSNPDEVQLGAKPSFKEVGPYIYDEFRERKIIKIDEDNDTIKFTQTKTYFFNRKESECRRESDLVTIINIGAINIANKVKTVAPSIASLLNDIFPLLFPNIKNIFITDSVENILFKGIKLSCESEDSDMVCDSIKSEMPPSIRLADNEIDLLLSLFHHINNTIDGPYVVQRGLKDTIKGTIVAFKNEKSFTQWQNMCSLIEGTDLTINPNLWHKQKRINFIAGDFCRSFSVNFDAEQQYKGLQSYKFKNSLLFDSEDNCYCTKTTPKCDALLGTMNLAPCTKSSIILSQPHFLGGDKTLYNRVKGLAPNIEKHGTTIVLEPKTGLALLVQTRFQMSLQLQKIEEIDLLANVSDSIFPFIWLEEAATVPDDIIEEVKNNLSKLSIFKYIQYILCGLGIALLAIGFVLSMIKEKIFCFQFLGLNKVSEKKTQLEEFNLFLKRRKSGYIPKSGNPNLIKKIWNVFD